MALGLLEPSAGDVRILGSSLYNPLTHPDYRAFRKSLAGKIQMIFQDPYSSLNPRMRVGKAIEEPLRWIESAPPPAQRTALAEEMLERVGLGREQANRYPHEFSGGQRQRIAIARALITHPAFVVCDEPTSSLDASVQAQVLNLLKDMQDNLGLTYMFISHDLAVIRHMADRVAVMYQGFVVEEADAQEIFSNPLHPYTRLLLESVPALNTAPLAKSADHSAAQQAQVGASAEQQEPKSNELQDAGSFCPFVDRCPLRMPRCQAEQTILQPLGTNQKVRCLLY
jgi:oligopeptide/dipeptide ABC transporter ATP-binding protein